MFDLYACGLLSHNELIAGFFEHLDTSQLEEDIRSLPTLLFNEIVQHFSTSPVSIPKPFYIGPATPESLWETEQIWKKKAELVLEYLKKH
jgi:hypothetical protein